MFQEERGAIASYIFRPNKFYFRLLESSVVALRSFRLLPSIVNACLIFFIIQLPISASRIEASFSTFSDLFIPTLLDDFLHWLDIVFGFLRRLDDP